MANKTTVSIFLYKHKNNFTLFLFKYSIIFMNIYVSSGNIHKSITMQKAPNKVVSQILSSCHIHPPTG